MKNNDCREVEKWIVRYANSARIKRGFSPVKPNKGIANAALNHSKRMVLARRLYHDEGSCVINRSITYNTFLDFVKSLFYRGNYGENVGIMMKGKVRGFKHSLRTPRDVALAQHRTWMRSRRHKANILNTNFSLIGVGVRKSKKNYYCTQKFYG